MREEHQKNEVLLIANATIALKTKMQSGLNTNKINEEISLNDLTTADNEELLQTLFGANYAQRDPF